MKKSEKKEKMKTIHLECNKCGIGLTNDLLEISQSKIIWQDETNVVPQNHFVNYTFNEKNSILVAINNYFLKTNPINNDFGCCGNSNEKSFNKTCANGHEVATEINDCYTGFYIAFDLDKVIIKEKKYNYAK